MYSKGATVFMMSKEFMDFMIEIFDCILCFRLTFIGGKEPAGNMCGDRSGEVRLDRGQTTDYI